MRTLPQFRAMRNWHVPWPNMDMFWLAFLKMNMKPLKIDVFLIFQVSMFKLQPGDTNYNSLQYIVFLEHLRGCRPLILRHIHIYIFRLLFLSIEQYYSLELTVPFQNLGPRNGAFLEPREDQNKLKKRAHTVLPPGCLGPPLFSYKECQFFHVFFAGWKGASAVAEPKVELGGS